MGHAGLKNKQVSMRQFCRDNAPNRQISDPQSHPTHAKTTKLILLDSLLQEVFISKMVKMAPWWA